MAKVLTEENKEQAPFSSERREKEGEGSTDDDDNKRTRLLLEKEGRERTIGKGETREDQ